jgi:predicted secreted protein
MADLPVTGLIVTFFLGVGALLAYGARRFGSGDEPAALGRSARQVSMGREVLWTGVATLLLFAVFLYVR